MVFPGSVYISFPTEFGTVYTLAQLEAIGEVCRQYGIPLFVDGARLGYGLTAPGTDVSLQDIARITDVFSIGGTKVGALFGEAVVFPRSHSPRHFLTLIKQHGALLAKGWLLGLQFDTLFTDDLYGTIAAHANDAAETIRTALRDKGYSLTFDSPTNQIFVTLDQQTISRLSSHVRIGFMQKADEYHSVMRICTSWATTPEHVAELISLL
jgi:threonine aldolase